MDKNGGDGRGNSRVKSNGKFKGGVEPNIYTFERTEDDS